MHEISKETLNGAYKPFDVVSDEQGSVGFIKEVSVNGSQPDPVHQIRYSINWLTGDTLKTAWWDHAELTKHCNLFVKIAEGSVHPMSTNKRWVQKLLDL